MTHPRGRAKDGTARSVPSWEWLAMHDPLYLDELKRREDQRHRWFFDRLTKPVPARLRFEVLRRDGYKCQICGATAQDGAKLHVDHKRARVKGGLTIEENLWTLCETCNLGKSAEDLETENA